MTSRAKKQAASSAKLLEILANYSGTSVDELKETVHVPQVEPYPFDNKSMQQEFCIEFLLQPSRYVNRRCKYCKEFFGSSYKSVAFCSDTCRAKEFLATTGVEWGRVGSKTQVEMWGGEPPRIIKPTLWKNLAHLLQTLKPVIENQDAPEYEEQQVLESQEESDLQMDSPANLPDEPVDEATLQFDVELDSFEF